MVTQWNGHVVVGVDGSSYAFGAVDWAADWASVHGMPLGLIAAQEAQFAARSASIAEHAERVGQQNAESDLAEAQARVEARRPGLQVRAEVVNLGAAAALTDASEDAALLVIGNRGLGTIKEKVLGGVASEVVTYATCPVVTVPHGIERPDGDLVVGLDGSECAAKAAEFAFEHAALSGAKVVAVSVWNFDVRARTGTAGLIPVPNLDAVEEDMRDALEEWVAPLRERFPQVPVETRAIRGHAATALLDTADAVAALLVVGSRGRAGFLRLLLGSTGQDVVRAARGAVAVVR